MAETERPTGPFILALIGGLLVLIDGVVVFLFGISGFIGRYHEFIPGIRPVIASIGIWGIICAIVTLASVLMLNRQPDQHALWGILIIVFSVLSLASGGGFIIGLILGIIGGIWALIWKPQEKKTEAVGSPPS